MTCKVGFFDTKTLFSAPASQYIVGLLELNLWSALARAESLYVQDASYYRLAKGKVKSFFLSNTYLRSEVG